jgi:hypothetical protein
MPRPNRPAPNWKQRFIVELRQDKKKTVVLCALTVVALVLGVRLVVKSLGPKAAAANPPASKRSEVAPPSAPRRPAPSPAAGQPPAGDVGEHVRRPADGRIQRDLFTGDLEAYRLLDPKPDKQPASRPAERPKVDLAQTIRAQAKTLALQSTMVGPDSWAMINGQVLRVGEWIGGFQVVAIDAGSCAVQRQGVRVSLQMNK